MKKTKFQRVVWDRTEEIDGVYDPDHPGLVIAKTTAEKPAWNTYSVYHEGSGAYVIELTFAKRKDAEAALRLIAPLTDWTLEGREQPSDLFRRVRNIEKTLMQQRLEVNREPAA